MGVKQDAMLRVKCMLSCVVLSLCVADLHVLAFQCRTMVFFFVNSVFVTPKKFDETAGKFHPQY